jgi:hypothetical protein
VPRKGVKPCLSSGALWRLVRLWTRSRPRSPEQPTAVRVGNRVAHIPLQKKRREALEQFLALLTELEGKDVYIGWCAGSRGHFWVNNLKVGRLQVEKFMGGDKLPGALILRGMKEASVRIFTSQVIALRQQDYQGYTLWLLDFWNGWGEHPIDQWKPPGYDSLHIVRFKD